MPLSGCPFFFIILQYDMLRLSETKNLTRYNLVKSSVTGEVCFI